MCILTRTRSCKIVNINLMHIIIPIACNLSSSHHLRPNTLILQYSLQNSNYWSRGSSGVWQLGTLVVAVITQKQNYCCKPWMTLGKTSQVSMLLALVVVSKCVIWELNLYLITDLVQLWKLMKVSLPFALLSFVQLVLSIYGTRGTAC